jgi:ribosomal protein S18 acetylase RimI-like enzyme
MNSIHIRKATKQDAETIVDCQIKMANETESLVLDESIVSNGVSQIINDSPLGYYLIAENEQKVHMGVMMVLTEWSDWRNGKVLWIHSLYVKPEYRKMGIFKALYSYLKNLVSTEDEYKGLRLFVEKNNVNAQKAYRAIGMTNDHYELFEWMKN